MARPTPMVWAISVTVCSPSSSICRAPRSLPGLPDVPKATLYRQVALLAEGRLLEVESEERVRAVIERHYRLHPARTVLNLDAVTAMSNDDHRRGFAAAVASLLAEFDVYLDRNGANPLADSVSYRQYTLWLSDAEKAAFVDDLVVLLRTRWTCVPRRNADATY